MKNILFDNWDSILRTIVLTGGGYFLMVLLLRVSGKRTLSKMNAFDFVVTVAMGSMLASIALSKNVALVDGLVAVGMLILLQFILTALSVRSKTVKRLITSQPSLLLWEGKILEHRLRKERVALDEIYSAARNAGHAGLENIAAIILETTGDLTIIGNINADGTEAIADVKGYDKTEGPKTALKLQQERGE